MTDITAEDLRAHSDAATQGKWGADLHGTSAQRSEYEPSIFVAVNYHPHNPAANTAFITALVNAFRAGELVHVSEVERLIIAAKSLVSDIEDLARDSEGVAGLHLNGDVTTWSSLMAGGAYQDWLNSVSILSETLAAFGGPHD
jgi:hypothetical protein